jgi:hypothetical protein
MRKERHESVDDVGPVREYLKNYVRHEKGEGSERDGTVHRLGDDPAARGHDDAVGGHDARADRRGQRDQREHARVEQQEALDRGQNVASSRGVGRGQHAGEQKEQNDSPDDGPTPWALDLSH